MSGTIAKRETFPKEDLLCFAVHSAEHAFNRVLGEPAGNRSCEARWQAASPKLR